MEAVEWLLELVASHVFLVDVDAVEDRLVEEAALFVVAALVQPMGVFEECEADVDESGAVGEVVAGGGEAFGEASSLAFDVAELGLDLGPGGPAGGQVDQVVFAGVECSQFVGELSVEELGSSFFFVNDVGDVGADIIDERGAESDARVVGFDGVLDQDGVDVRGVASAGLLVAAEEVGVLAASGVDGVLEDQALGDPFALATAAEE
ncbi:MAG TPA: hypothetical protein VFU43_04135 [Streptosporangiaceae bacterium]|nr:hypothetical protein [Streptosporangiaceae bacterium]